MDKLSTSPRWHRFWWVGFRSQNLVFRRFVPKHAVLMLLGRHHGGSTEDLGSQASPSSPSLPKNLLPLASLLSCSCVCVCSVVPTLCYPPNSSCPWKFSKQEYWSELPFPLPGDFPDLGNWTCVSCIGRHIVYHWATWEVLSYSC